MTISTSIGVAGGTFQQLEQAVRAWVLAAATTQGLPPEAVYFANQEWPGNPGAARITIAIDGPFVVGVDGQIVTFDDERPNGEEVGLSAEGNRELVVRLQAFAPQVVGAGPTAQQIAAACLAVLGADSVRSALWAAGLGVLVPGDVVTLPAVVSGRHEGRAALDSRFSVRQEVTERVGYFETAVLEGVVAPE